MGSIRTLKLASFILTVLMAALARAQQTAAPPLPDIRQLMREVQEHQKQLEKVRENYTYSSLQTTQDLDSNGTGEEDRDRGVRGVFCQ